MKFWVLAAVLPVLIGCAPSGESPAPETTAASVEPEVSQTVVPETAPQTQPMLVPEAFDVPERVTGEGFELVPLGPDLVQIDYDAYMSSIEHLQTTFTRSSNWPTEDISAADAMLDMENEQSRFLNRESFAYAVLTPDGTRERGCVYVRPSNKPGYDAEVRLWVTKAEFDAGFDEELYAWVTQWVESTWPFAGVAYPGRAIEWSDWDALPEKDSPDAAEGSLLAMNMATAEGFIDAFYSFDPERLRPFLAQAEESATSLMYYQGWAEGGNYKIVRRGACVPESAERFRCPITVQDDPVLALQTGFNVTDTFALTFEGQNIVDVDTSSNDQPIYYEARKWVEENMPEVMSGPCLNRRSGGTTPGDCARAMTEGYRLFYETMVAEGSEQVGDA